MKKFLSVLIAMTMIISCVATVAFADVSGITGTLTKADLTEAQQTTAGVGAGQVGYILKLNLSNFGTLTSDGDATGRKLQSLQLDLTFDHPENVVYMFGKSYKTPKPTGWKTKASAPFTKQTSSPHYSIPSNSTDAASLYPKDEGEVTSIPAVYEMYIVLSGDVVISPKISGGVQSFEDGELDGDSEDFTNVALANLALEGPSAAPTTYTITFKDKDNNTIGTPSTVEEGATPEAPEAPTVTGYHFTGWSPAIAAATADATYTAQYAINTYTITFKGKDGATTISTPTVNYNVVPTAPSAPEVTGYHFTGWSPALVAATADATYTAQYAINTYTITFKGKDGATTISTPTVNYNVVPTAPAAPEVAGYTFTGWSPALVAATADATYTATYSKDPVNVESVTLDKHAITVSVGAAAQTLTATVLPGDADDKTVVWTSNNEAVATVANGVVTIVGAGKATITATSNADGTKADSCVVKVNPADVEPTTFKAIADGAALQDLAGKAVAAEGNYGAAKIEAPVDTTKFEYKLVATDTDNVEKEWTIADGLEISGAAVDFIAIVHSATHVIKSIVLRAIAK